MRQIIILTLLTTIAAGLLAGIAGLLFAPILMRYQTGLIETGVAATLTALVTDTLPPPQVATLTDTPIASATDSPTATLTVTDTSAPSTTSTVSRTPSRTPSSTITASNTARPTQARPTSTATARPLPTQAPPPTQPPQPTGFDNNGDGRVTCADFATQAQAQAAYEAGYTRLDGNDNDGRACETLP